jgi:hypothetical protein
LSIAAASFLAMRIEHCNNGIFYYRRLIDARRYFVNLNEARERRTYFLETVKKIPTAPADAAPPPLNQR